MSDSTKRICIVGGGFGGLYTALRLSQFPWKIPQDVEITLIDREDRFVFLPLLYELMTGELQSWEIAPPYIELLAQTGIRFHQGNVSRINVQQQQVQLEAGEVFDYDRLVLALGGETPLDVVPGAADYAYPFRSIHDAYQLEEKVRSLEASDKDMIRVAIVGGGYSGVELACKLSDRLGERGRLRLVHRNERILPSSTDFNREAALQALQQREVWVDTETSVVSVSDDTISLDYRGQVDEIPADLVLWTVGTQVASAVRSLPGKHNDRGQLYTNVYLQVPEHPEIFALGDAAECKDANGERVPATAQAAFQQADYAGWNVWASLSDRPLLPFRYQHLGEMMTLGVDNATLTGLGWQLDGPAAHIFRRLIYLYRLPNPDHQIRVGLNWIAQPLRELIFGN